MSKSNIFENSKSSENSVISNFKIIYLHGFNSAAFGRKYDALTETFGEENVFGINQPTSPIATIKLFSFLIESLLQKNTNLWLFGSSQGAFFARYFTYKYGVPSILVNPMIYPDTIKEYINTEMENFKTHKKYVYKKEWSEFLKSLAIKKEQISKFKDRIFIFVDEGDELLDHSQTQAYFDGFYFKAYKGGDHFFQHLDEMMVELKQIISAYSPPTSYYTINT